MKVALRIAGMQETYHTAVGPGRRTHTFTIPTGL